MYVYADTKLKLGGFVLTVWKGNTAMYNCKQCGKPLNPVQVMLGPVCGDCVRENHKKVAGKK